jgi:branched-subunit amino acid transport protein
MSEVWIVVIAVGALTIVLKSVGPVLLGGRELPERALSVVDLLAPALLAALVAVSIFGLGKDLVLDARVIGLFAAVAALLLRAPIIVVVLTAAVATALARAIV